MRIHIIDTYYPNFLKYFWREHPDLHKTDYKTQMQALLAERFGTSDFYSYNLQKLGQQSQDFILNDYTIAKSWAKENKKFIADHDVVARIKLFPLIHRYVGRPKWVQDIALEQIIEEKPDVVYIQDLSILNNETLQAIRNRVKLLVGQIASPLPELHKLRQFGLIISSIPGFVTFLKKNAIPSEYLKLAFEPRLLKEMPKTNRTYDVSFIGSFTPNHRFGTKLLEKTSKNVPVNIWGQHLPTTSPLRTNYHGEVWGKKMFEVLAQSKIVLNRHISTAGENANNMRLYEATGMGALLITDMKKNIDELFTVGKEIITYTDENDLSEKIKYFLKNENERAKIASSGQKRTLTEHNYLKRMRELMIILGNYL